MPADELLLPRIFRDSNQSYTCGLAGKLHLASCSHHKVEARIEDGYADEHFHWSHHPQPDWGDTNAYTKWLSDNGLTWEELYQQPPHPNPYIKNGIPAEHHQTTWCAEETIHFINTQTKSPNPWFFSFNCFAPHHPFDPPAEYLEKYNPADMPLPDYRDSELENKPSFQQLDREWAHNSPSEFHTAAMSDDDKRHVTAAYYAMCDHIDHEIGRILKALDDTGQRDNTLVIFMSDHGEMLGDHGIYFKGPHFYDPAIRVPLILRLPGIFKENHRVDSLTELTDLAPTLCEAAAIPPPPDRFQGTSLLPLLTGQTNTHRENILCQYDNAWTHPDAYATCLRTQSHKITRYHATNEGELYDLENDPHEFENLWSSSDHQSVKQDLLQHLLDRSHLTTLDPHPPRRGPF